MTARTHRRGPGPANGASREARPRIAAPVLVAALALAGCGSSGRPPSVLSVRVPDGVLSSRDAVAWPIGNGRAVTVAHVLSPGRPVFVGGRRARVVSADSRLDIAVLAVAGLRGVARFSSAQAGEHVTIRVVGHSIPATVRRLITAHVSGTARPALELRADVQPGDSGAPVLDAQGRVIGVLFAEASDRAGLAYAVALPSIARGLPRRR
jgi:S1-C subfamily serine protease